MGGPGSGRKRARPAARCPEHPGSSVTTKGSYTTASGERRRYQCIPIGGDAAHRFSVPVQAEVDVEAELAELFLPRWSPKPKCPQHPDSHVVRNGTYGSHTPKRRQRYRCYPNQFDRTTHHAFTPPLPRDHVCEGDEHCAHCEELRGIHRGETAVARRHSWPTRIVVRGLEQLASGATYADVGRWALRITDTKRTKTYRENDDEAGAEPEKRRRSASSEASRNSWHVAADWVEAFSPPIWATVDRPLRDTAVQERQRLDALIATGQPIDVPQVLLLDDIPVYGRDLDTGKSRRDAGFFILAAAEVRWDQPDDPFMAVETTTKLRLLRALPKSNAAAWRLVFDELGYAPDFVVADAGSGIIAAINAHFDPLRTRLIPSLWHLARNVEVAFADAPGAFVASPSGKQLIAPIAGHFRQLHRGAALASATAWGDWWDELDRLLISHHLPVEKTRARRASYEPQFIALLDAIHDHPQLPISTGGLETLLAKHVQPILAMRRTAFANVERTNLLLDLVVARHHGAFDDLNDIVTLLRADNNEHDGWTVALRSISDPRPHGGTYSSLRDATLLTSLAEQRGLT